MLAECTGFALLGVGLCILRRDWLDRLMSLALSVFSTVTPGQIGIGVEELAFVGFWVVYGVVSDMWSLLVTPEQLAAQSAASEQIIPCV